MRHAFALALVTIAGCHHDRSTQEKPPQPAASRDRAVEPSRQLAPLFARLEYEATHRPASQVPAEKALDALQSIDLRVDQRRQFVGATVHANYCLGGKTTSGLVVAACEYATHEAAKEGMTFMDERYKAMAPSARRAVRGTTVLTIATPASMSEDLRVARALEVFAAL